MQVSIEIWYDNHCLCNSIHVGDLIHKDMIYYILRNIRKYYEAVWGKRDACKNVCNGFLLLPW